MSREHNGETRRNIPNCTLGLKDGGPARGARQLQSLPSSAIRWSAQYRRSGFLLRMLLALATALLVALPSARADYLDDVEVLHAGDNTVIRINFNVQVQYLRHVPEREGDLVQIFLRVLSNDPAPPIPAETWTPPCNPSHPQPGATLGRRGATRVEARVHETGVSGRACHPDDLA